MAQLRQNWILLFFIIVLVLLPSNLFAQEETETPSAETAVITTTPEPVSTATDLPTQVEATVEITSPPIVPQTTAEVTEIVTEPSIELTTEVTAEIGDAALPPPEVTQAPLPIYDEPDLTAIVSEPFLSDSNPNWLLGAGWQLIPLDGNFALQSTGTSEQALYSAQSFSDVAVEAVIQSQTSTAELRLRQFEAEAYRLTLTPDGLVTIYRNDMILASTTVAASTENQWRHVRFSVMGYTLRVAIDGAEVLVTNDSQPLLTGTVGFMGIASDLNSLLWVDNVRIWIPSSQLVVEAVTAMPVPTVVAAPTQFPTPSPASSINSLVNWDKLASYDFEEEESYFFEWEMNTSWSPVLGQSGQALQIGGGVDPLEFSLHAITNAAIETDFLLNSANTHFKIAFRDNGQSSYLVSILATGEIELLRNNVAVASGTAANLNVNSWHHLRVEVYADVVSVSINGNNILVYEDVLPLSSGRIILGKNTDGSSTFLVDNVHIWMPYEEIPWRRFENTANNFSIQSSSIEMFGSQALTSATADNITELRDLLEPYSETNPENCPDDDLEITLTDDIDVSDAYSSDDDILPEIFCNSVTIDGSNNTIQNVGSHSYRSFVRAGVDLILQDLTIEGFEFSALINTGGALLELDNVKIIDNIGTTGFSFYVVSNTFGMLHMHSGTQIRGNFVNHPNILSSTIRSTNGITNIEGTANNPIIIEDNIEETGTVVIQQSDSVTLDFVTLRRNSKGTPSPSEPTNLPIQIAAANVMITNTLIEDQSGIQFSGFGVNATVATVNIQNSIITNNTESYQSVIQVVGYNNIPTVSFNITNSCITNNVPETANDYVLEGVWNAQNNWWGNAGGPSALGIPIDPAANVSNPLSTAPNLAIGDNCIYNEPSYGSPGLVLEVPSMVFTNNSGGDSEIWKASGNLISFLTANDYEDTNPSLSSDGSQIAFQSLRNSVWGIYVMNEDGSGETPLVLNNAIEPDWYPNSSDLVFARGANIYRVNTIGAPVENQLTNHGSGAAHNPAISSDGNWVIYEHNGNLYVVDATCNSTCTSTLIQSGGTHSYPAWSPDGTQLAWSSNDDIYTATVNYSNSAPQLIGAAALSNANSPQIDTHPSYSSDGQFILIESNRNGPKTLFKAGSNGLGFDELLSNGGQGDIKQDSDEDLEYEYYERFIGIMFWSIYNETNENEHVPLIQVLPNVSPSVPSTLMNFDHRYVMARTILSNIPMDDISIGVGYMRGRWGGSIGNTGYGIWNYGGVSQCQWNGNSIGTYADAVATSSEQVLNWFNGYTNCHRSQQLLEGSFIDFDSSYIEILSHINQAIDDHIAEVDNPAPGALYVKHTSSCFVWHRDPATQQITGCRGPNGRIDMLTFCSNQPVGRTPPLPQNRNCRASAINPANVNVTAWLTSDDGRNSNQQLGLETTVGRNYIINLGFYTPDQPLTNPSTNQPTSGQGCETNCYFLLGNSFDDSLSETLEASWQRHETRHLNSDYGYRPNGTTFYVFVLRTERDSGAQTWITFAFQTQ